MDTLSYKTRSANKETVEKNWVLIDAEDQEFGAHALLMLTAGPFDSDTWGAWTSAGKEATGRKGKALFMPLRKALTGLSHGPDMGALLPLLQKIPRD